MRILAVFPLLCSIAAFTLGLLCIFAGTKPGYLENVDMLTLNTTMLGTFAVNTSATSGGSSFIAGIEGQLVGDVNGIIQDVARKLNIHEFYSAHMMDYCEGFYTPSPFSNATVYPTKNVTSCSNQTALFTFDPTAILQQELGPNRNLSDLKWPSQVQDAVVAIQTATRTMFICYCIGVGFAGLAIIGALIGLISGGRLSDSLNAVIDLLTFLAFGIASGIETAVVVKVVDAVNQYGNQIGIAAYKGSTFMVLTWVATGVMLAASITWLVDCCIPRRNKVREV